MNNITLLQSLENNAATGYQGAIKIDQKSFQLKVKGADVLIQRVTLI